MKNPVGLKRYKNVKLFQGFTSDETKTTEGLLMFLFWKIMKSHEIQE